jgi:hypothetical protein
MSTKQAVEYINRFQGYTGIVKDEDELETVHVATVAAIGSKIETVLKPGADLYDALDAYANTPAGKMLRDAAGSA